MVPLHLILYNFLQDFVEGQLLLSFFRQKKEGDDLPSSDKTKLIWYQPLERKQTIVYRKWKKKYRYKHIEVKR